MVEVPEPQIEVAELATDPHDHVHAEARDGSLQEHLVRDHRLDAPPTLSPATLEGLHDRVHGESHAGDD